MKTPATDGDSKGTKDRNEKDLTEIETGVSDSKANTLIMEGEGDPPDGTGSIDSEENVQTYIRRLSSVLMDPRELSVDEELLGSVIRQAGEFSFGIAAVEVYSFEDPRLLPVSWWLHPDMSLVNPSNNTTYAPEVQIPGVDLVGALWASPHSSSDGMIRSSSFSSLVGIRSEKTSDSPPAAARLGGGNLHWRELRSLIEDPDVIHGPRSEALNNAGIEKATGVSFNSHGNHGLVVYYAKAGVDPSLLSGVANETYLRRAALLIGSVLAMTEARRASVAFQRQSSGSTCRLDCSEEATKVQSQAPSSLCATVNWKLTTWFKKSRGGGSQIPAGMSFDESLFTVFGAFVGLLTMSSLNEFFHFVSNEEYFLVLAPFGALVTLQYGLTAAPASQPRNVVLGHIVAGAVSLLFTYIPGSILPTWIRQAVAPAFAIGAMVKLGIPHPPAGAQSVIFSTGDYNWAFYALAVLCSVISIIPATIVNNMSQKRQYPTYWGYLPAYISRRRNQKTLDKQAKHKRGGSPECARP